jgi:hypothetical protein
MKQKINLGIGFISGRPNVCKIINNYEQFMVEQLKELDVEVDITIYILYDLNYQHTIRTDFYGILPKAYKNLRIKYITPENIIEYQKILMSRYGMSNADAKLLIGNGYAKARNTILYCAMQHKMDYILFWDDDEYPVANVLEDDQLLWIKQKNILEHVKNIKNTDVSMGYRCGMMNPVPYIQYTDEIKEEDYKNFIDALENEVISWEKIQKMRENTSSISYADPDIARGIKKAEYVEGIGKENFVLGSGICLNLDNIDKIPAFYNPPNARGEDTFFSCALRSKDAKVLRIPTYHFHDSFLQYTGIMKGRYPKKLGKISLVDAEIEQRFLKATIGWTRYKPLLYYITDRENYDKIIEESRDKLKRSVQKINTEFVTCDFSCLIRELNKYDNDVEKHYEEYLRVIDLWDKFKKDIREG